MRTNADECGRRWPLARTAPVDCGTPSKPTERHECCLFLTAPEVGRPYPILFRARPSPSERGRARLHFPDHPVPASLTAIEDHLAPVTGTALREPLLKSARWTDAASTGLY